jgi:hypothetical protein
MILLCFSCKIAETRNILAQNTGKRMANQIEYYKYFNLDSHKSNKQNSQNPFTLAQNSGKNNADFRLIHNVILMLIPLFLTRRIANTHFILAPNFG